MDISFLSMTNQTRVLFHCNCISALTTTAGRRYARWWWWWSMAYSGTRIHNKRLPRNLRNAQRSQLPPDFGVNLFLRKEPTIDTAADPPPSKTDLIQEEFNPDLELEDDDDEEETEEEAGEDGGGGQDRHIDWESHEIEAISSLFQGRIPQKPGKLPATDRPLPLPLPYKLRPLGFPTPKQRLRLASPRIASSRAPILNKLYKNPNFLVSLAKRIKSLGPEQDVSVVLDDSARFLRKGSLSLTIRELGHMGLPDRALQTFCWAQRQPLLFPDDRILASTVEVLARNHDLKVPFDLLEFTSLARRGVIEAMIRGFIRGGNLKLAWILLFAAKHGKRTIETSVYAKLILELGKNPDKHVLAAILLDELGEREDLNLSQQDCTAIMKVCIKLERFHVAEGLFNWFKQLHEPSVVMYTTLIHSYYSETKYREALALVWEMENLNCLFDLPAYRVVIKLFVALNDLSRAGRYFSKLKEAGFSPTHDLYRDLISLYMASGRFAKCKGILKEAEMAGLELDSEIRSGTNFCQFQQVRGPCTGHSGPVVGSSAK